MPINYTIIPKRGYVELWVNGKHIGNFDTREEALAELRVA